MNTPLSARESEVVALAGELADEFAQTADEHDRENRFPAENWPRMRDAGYLRLCVPEELGGFGAGVREFFLAQERLAQGDAATALAVNMHLAPSTLMSLAWRRFSDQRADRHLRRIATGGEVFASCTSEHGMGGVQGATDARTTAERVDGGYRVSGHKIFFTGNEGCTHFSSNARHEDPELGPRLISFFSPIDAEGITLKQTWDTLGMRATQSNDVFFEDVFVPEEEVGHSSPAGHFDQRIQQSLFTGAMPSFGIIFLGAAGGAMDWARSFVIDKGRAGDGEVQRDFAEMEVLRESARAVTYRHAHEVDSGLWFEALGVREGLARAAFCKYVCVNNAVAIMNKVMGIVGGQGYHRKFPIQRIYRDVLAGPILPFNNHDTHRILAEEALDLPPGELGVFDEPEAGERA